MCPRYGAHPSNSLLAHPGDDWSTVRTPWSGMDAPGIVGIFRLAFIPARRNSGSLKMTGIRGYVFLKQRSVGLATPVKIMQTTKFHGAERCVSG